MSPSPRPSPGWGAREAASPASASSNSSGGSLTLPLHPGFFGDVQVSATKQQDYRSLVRRRVNALLVDEQRFAERQQRYQPRLHPAEWKFVGSQGELQMYRRRRRRRSLRELAAQEDCPEAARAVENGQPSMLTIGRVAGSIEDILFGLFDTTQEEMQTTMAYLHGNMNSALLNTLELATPEDPMHYLGLKWVLTKGPATAIITPRDVCCLEAMGLERDASGRRYGYLVLHSVDLNECPPFDRKKLNVIRAKMFFSCLFRETTPGYVDVLVRGIFEMGGDIPRVAMPHATAAFMGGLFNAVGCAEAKKLTLLARHNIRTGRNRGVALPNAAVCAVCIKRGRSGLFSGVRLHACRVCGVAICLRCSVKHKRMFLGPERPCSACVCCPKCAMEAQRMTGLRPTEPEYSVVAEYYRRRAASSSSSSTSTDALAPPARHLRLDTLSRYAVVGNDSRDQRDFVDVDAVLLRSEMVKSNSMLEMATNSTADESWVGQETMEDYFEAGEDCAETLSDLDSAEYRFSSSSNEADSDDLYQKEAGQAGQEAKPIPDVAELLRKRQAIDGQLRRVESTMRELELAAEHSSAKARVTIADFTGSVATFGDNHDSELSDQCLHLESRRTSEPAASEEMMMKKMRALQSTADQVFAMAQSNKEIMQSLRR
ncbi:hypothetical protein BBJ28_00020229 [Nothophytophthora sp. Chile5]|nr:hypothetical protein BBJ28_00020229 [Nothophytophthora sp. Chile5]